MFEAAAASPPAHAAGLREHRRARRCPNHPRLSPPPATTNGIRIASVMRYDRKYIDLEAKTLQSQPLRPGLSPLS